MIVVDIGNTSINFAWFCQAKIIKLKTLATANASAFQIKKIVGRCSNETIVICSVVPKAIKKFYGCAEKLYIVGKNINVPIKSLYNPKHIGMDRLVSAYAAKQLFGDVRIIIDFGTAITMDFVSAKGLYQGGIILPGIGSTKTVLSQCALLPKKIKLARSTKAIPRDTLESITKGLELGFSSMLNELVASYKRRLKIPAQNQVVITGGEAIVPMPHLKFPYRHEPLLVLKGLYLLARRFGL